MKKIVEEHVLVPKQVLLSRTEADKILKEYNVTIREMPKVLKNDPSISDLGAKSGDIVKVVRKSKTAGEAMFYRGVINA